MAREAVIFGKINGNRNGGLAELFVTFATSEIKRAALRGVGTPQEKRLEVKKPLDRTIEENTDAYRAATNRWFRSQGYVPTGQGMWGIAWSTRSGYDFTDLEWYPLQRHSEDQGWDAIIGCHASGENPRLIIGTCENLADIQRTHEAIRLINGYKGPEDQLLQQVQSGPPRQEEKAGQ